MSDLLHHYLDVMDQLLTLGRQQLQPEEWDVFTRRLAGTPLADGYSVQETWSPPTHLAYWWPRLTEDEQHTFLREQCPRRFQRRAR